MNRFIPGVYAFIGKSPLLENLFLHCGISSWQIKRFVVRFFMKHRGMMNIG
jgi:hypothetical protein